jgi:hypothetical protein
MPNPNRPENTTSIAGAIVAIPMAASIRHDGVTNRYIDTNAGHRAALGLTGLRSTSLLDEQSSPS